MVDISQQAVALLVPAGVSAAGSWDPNDRTLGEVLRDWRTAERVDVGIVGVPFDTAILGRRGARFGPAAIRTALYRAYTWGGDLDVDLADEAFGLADFGDVRVAHTDVERTHARLRTVVAAIAAAGVTPFVLGGDNSTSFASIAGILDARGGGPLGLVVIDAHHDLRAPHDGEISSGTPYRRLLELPGAPISAAHVVQVGLSPFRTSRHYADYARAQGIHVVGAREVHRRGPEAVAQVALAAAASSGAFFLSVDVDACDPAFAPGTSAHSPGGLTPYELLELTLALSQHPACVGFDLTETSPPLDLQTATSELAATVVLYALAGRARVARQPG